MEPLASHFCLAFRLDDLAAKVVPWIPLRALLRGSFPSRPQIITGMPSVVARREKVILDTIPPRPELDLSVVIRFSTRSSIESIKGMTFFSSFRKPPTDVQIIRHCAS